MEWHRYRGEQVTHNSIADRLALNGLTGAAHCSLDFSAHAFVVAYTFGAVVNLSNTAAPAERLYPRARIFAEYPGR